MPLNIDWQQILLHMLNFTVLFGVSYFLLYSPVKKFMEKREKEYRDRETETQEQLQNAARLREEYEARLAQAEDEVVRRREDAQKQAEDAAEQIRTRAEREAKEIVDQARREARREHDAMLAHVGEEISELAAAAAEKIVFSDPEQALDSFLNSAERGKSDE